MIVNIKVKEECDSSTTYTVTLEEDELDIFRPEGSVAHDPEEWDLEDIEWYCEVNDFNCEIEPGFFSVSSISEILIPQLEYLKNTGFMIEQLLDPLWTVREALMKSMDILKSCSIQIPIPQLDLEHLMIDMNSSMSSVLYLPNKEGIL